MSTAPAAPERVTLLREVCEGPVAALLAGERRRGDEVRLVAVKVLRNRRARDREQLADMRDTGRRLDRISHRNIVAATDLALVDGRPALLGPWVEGIDLLDWVEALKEADAALPGRVVCDLLRGAAAALDAARHRTAHGEREPLGIVHRDIKPTNLMVGRDGELKVLDFGTGFTSLAGRDARARAAKAGLARYLSPGRRQGKRGGPASDVYALGLLGVELLRGRWLQRVRDANPDHDRHLAEIVAGLPDTGMRAPADDRALRALLLRMVAFDSEARPPAIEVATTLRTLADRANGPSLEAFAHEHALPYVDPPDPAQGLPEVVLVEPDQLPEDTRPEGSGEIPIQVVRAGLPPDDPSDEVPLPSGDVTAVIERPVEAPVAAPVGAPEVTPVSAPKREPAMVSPLPVVAGAVGGIGAAGLLAGIVGLVLGLMIGALLWA